MSKGKDIELASELFYYLTQGREISESNQKKIGIYDNMQLMEKINRMSPGEYREKLSKGEVQNYFQVEAQVIRKAEEHYERNCGTPPNIYVDILNEELEKLGNLAFKMSDFDNPFLREDFLVKYGIDRTATAAIKFCQIEKAYRNLDDRLVSMTGKRPTADNIFGKQDVTSSQNSELDSALKKSGLSKVVLTDQQKQTLLEKGKVAINGGKQIIQKVSTPAGKAYRAYDVANNITRQSLAEL